MTQEVLKPAKGSNVNIVENWLNLWRMKLDWTTCCPDLIPWSIFAHFWKQNDGCGWLLGSRSTTHTHTHTQQSTFIPSNLIYTHQITSSELNQQLKLESSLEQRETSFWKCERLVPSSNLLQTRLSAAAKCPRSLHHLAPLFIHCSRLAGWVLDRQKSCNPPSRWRERRPSSPNTWIWVWLFCQRQGVWFWEEWNVSPADWATDS